MPREFDIIPCDSQRATMEAMGFRFDPEGRDPREVTWMGHGLSITLKVHCALTIDQATRLIVEAAMNKARENIRDGIRVLFDMPIRLKMDL